VYSNIFGHGIFVSMFDKAAGQETGLGEHNLVDGLNKSPTPQLN
jgi:hypothetical protein